MLVTIANKLDRLIRERETYFALIKRGSFLSSHAFVTKARNVEASFDVTSVFSFFSIFVRKIDSVFDIHLRHIEELSFSLSIHIF